MAKEIILYNLAPHVTDAEYCDYVTKEKGPLLESLSSVKKFELVNITGSHSGNVPYNTWASSTSTAWKTSIRTTQILGEMASFITVGRSAFLELAHEYDMMDIYGLWNTPSMVGKGHAVHAYITRTVPDLLLRGMELMGSYGYVRENHYEKYFRDAPIAKIVMGGSHLGYFAVCRQFYDLDYSSFGPGKLKDPTKP